MKQINTGELPEKTDAAALKLFFDNVNSDLFLRCKEEDFFKSLGYSPDQVKHKIKDLNRKVERARARWACISAISQRNKKTEAAGRKDWYHKIDQYEGLTTIQPVYERTRPISAGREAGETINTFTKRSRQRLLSKARRLNKQELKLPYFITLTYRENMQDYQKAKKHLNAFFQRFRRMDEIHVKFTKLETGRINTRKISAGEFQYFWKMEPQKRGSIHFHLAFFEPKDLFPEAWDKKGDKFKLEFLKMRISAAWNEVTGQHKGFTPERTRNGKYYGNMALLAGTNVRAVENWKMFVGYIGKYMQKEISEKTLSGEGEMIKRSDLKKIDGSAAAACTRINRIKYAHSEWYKQPLSGMLFDEIERKSIKKKTGRWWGFSYGLDFKALQQTAYTKNDKKNLNEFCNALNALAFKSITEQLTENAKRAKETLTGDRLFYRLNHLRNSYKKQKKRFIVNKDKIKEGCSLQFEINHKISSFCKSLLDDKSIEDLFEP